MFKCKACPIHERRIADLKSQIMFLRSQIGGSSLPAKLALVDSPSRQNQTEAEQDSFVAEVLKEHEEIKLEADRLLSGTYGE